MYRVNSKFIIVACGIIFAIIWSEFFIYYIVIGQVSTLKVRNIMLLNYSTCTMLVYSVKKLSFQPRTLSNSSHPYLCQYSIRVGMVLTRLEPAFIELVPLKQKLCSTTQKVG